MGWLGIKHIGNPARNGYTDTVRSPQEIRVFDQALRQVRAIVVLMAIHKCGGAAIHGRSSAAPLPGRRGDRYDNGRWTAWS